MQYIQVNAKIRLEEIRMSMAPVIYNAIENDRENLKTWLPFVDMTKQVSDTEGFIRSVVNQKSPARDIVYSIWFKEEFAGLVGLKEIDWLNRKSELGYWLIGNMEGWGIMTESVKKVIKYSFQSLKLNRIQIKVAVGNKRSEAIPKRLGFTFEGIERDGEYHNQQFLDLKVFSLIKTDTC